jgi:hypothetical protein
MSTTPSLGTTVGSIEQQTSGLPNAIGDITGIMGVGIMASSLMHLGTAFDAPQNPYNNPEMASYNPQLPANQPVPQQQSSVIGPIVGLAAGAAMMTMANWGPPSGTATGMGNYSANAGNYNSLTMAGAGIAPQSTAPSSTMANWVNNTLGIPQNGAPVASASTPLVNSGAAITQGATTVANTANQAVGGFTRALTNTFNFGP